MKRYGPLLVMLGLLLGPTYYVFCQYLSGENGDTFVLTERAARWTLPDGTILHVSNGKAFRPVTLKLDPEMNQIAFRLTFEAAPGSSDAAKATDEYQITLLQSDQPIFERALVVKLAPGGKASVEAADSQSTTPEPTSFSCRKRARLVLQFRRSRWRCEKSSKRCFCH